MRTRSLIPQFPAIIDSLNQRSVKKKAGTADDANRQTTRIILLRRMGDKLVTYACGHQAESLMVFRCPDIFMGPVAKLKLLVDEYHCMPDVIIFDPLRTISERIPHVTDRCPRCFFGELMESTGPSCYLCGKPIAPDSEVVLDKKQYQPQTMPLNVARVPLRGNRYLVRCQSSRRCRSMPHAKSWAWDGRHVNILP